MPISVFFHAKGTYCKQSFLGRCRIGSHRPNLEGQTSGSDIWNVAFSCHSRRGQILGCGTDEGESERNGQVGVSVQPAVWETANEMVERKLESGLKATAGD